MSRFILCCILPLLFPAALIADRYVTVTASSPLVIAAGETALVVSYVGSPSAPMSYTPTGGTSTTFQLEQTGALQTTRAAPSISNPLIFTGPATLSVTTTTGGLGVRIVTTVHSTSVAASESGMPSNAVVIPSEVEGLVSIILESSTDLVTWTAATPGNYGASTSNRFFRVRAVQN